MNRRNLEPWSTNGGYSFRWAWGAPLHGPGGGEQAVLAVHPPDPYRHPERHPHLYEGTADDLGPHPWSIRRIYATTPGKCRLRLDMGRRTKPRWRALVRALRRRQR